MTEERKNLLSILAQSNLLDSVPCAIFLKDTESRFIGCNQFLANLAGYCDQNDLIGKTDHEMPWANELTHYHEVDQKVINNKTIIESIETIRLPDREIIARTIKSPLHYQEKIIGIVGYFSDITEIKQNEIKLKEAKEKAEVMNAAALQVAHDIRSPLAAIMMLAEACVDIPEAQRLCLREAAGRIQDIANQLLTKHGKEEALQEKDALSPVMVSMALLSVISSKRMEYQHTRIKLHFETGSEAYFVFIKANIIEFKRMISNLINNAIEALMQDSGEVRVTLHKNGSRVIVSIIDAGCGMSTEKIQEILHDEKINTQKTEGFGLGLAHAKKFLKKINATLQIHSSAYNGTTLELGFNLCPAPQWITNEIHFNLHDCIVVLDDDQSIHGAWDEIFSSMLKKHSGIKLMHFTQGEECVEYINTHLCPENLLLLTDYELIGQSISGLDVIKKTNAQRAILVTSHYENQEVIKRSDGLNVKVLPKMLASQVKLIVNQQTKPMNKSLIQVDLILLDDNKAVSDTLSLVYEMKDKTLKAYNSPYPLLEEILLYAKETKICTDYTLNCSMTGLDVAKILHEKGFKNLYLATGHEFKQENLPEYIRLLEDKAEIANL